MALAKEVILFWAKFIWLQTVKAVIVSLNHLSFFFVFVYVSLLFSFLLNSLLVERQYATAGSGGAEKRNPASPFSKVWVQL